ncbi:MAG TPA: hypothetical protein VD813_01245 [Pseudonocardia sp.]|nr:hypothetical protein [Pseudonocardia sp.]
MPPLDTLRTVTGTVRHHTSAPRPGSRLADGRLVPQAGFVESTIPADAPRVPVEILRPDGSLLATTVTDDRGRFSVQVNFGQNPATQVFARAVARLDLPFGTKVRVFPNAAATETWSKQSALGGDPLAAQMTVNVEIALDEGAAAYHMLKTLWQPFLLAKSGITAAMPDLDILWEPGNGTESSFASEPTRARFLVAGGAPGDPASARDEWDAGPLVRLHGEYLLEYFLTDRAPEGEPSAAPLVPSLAWREGFLDFWACAGRGTSEYWDTEGEGPDGRVVRFFDVESYFDPSLPALGGPDPNVYQDPALVGLGSAFSVAEILWDIHDADGAGTDDDGVEFDDFFLTMRFLTRPLPGIGYPYLFTLLNEYARPPAAIPAVTLDQLLRGPEDQGMRFPATLGNGFLWPPQISPDGQPGLAIAPPFEKTVPDLLDTLNPDPVNVEVGLQSQRYHMFDLVQTADVTATVSPSDGLIVEILDLNNVVLASGPSPQTAQDLPARRYIVRVRSSNDPQATPFDLTLTLTAP